LIYDSIFKCKEKKLGVLIDPGKQALSDLNKTVKNAQSGGADFFLIGGSIVSQNIDKTISIVKKISDLPIILFPGSVYQLSDKADAVLLLSLISGRNPDFLIGNHVTAAPFLKKSNLEIISTGYILMEGGSKTSVEYMSNSKPIPANKTDIAVATALAGEMLGLSAIYLEAGSGALYPVNNDIVRAVRDNINIPLIVGGGIKDEKTLKNICKAGAEVIITGTAFETNSDLIKKFADIIHHS